MPIQIIPSKEKSQEIRHELISEIKQEFSQAVEIEIFFVYAGIIVQAIAGDNLDKLDKIIARVCLKKNREEKYVGVDLFPFKVYCYNDQEKAFTTRVFLKTQSQNIVDNEIKSRYINAPDAYINLREMDFAALYYDISLPFLFKFKSAHKSTLLFNEDYAPAYKCLSLNGKEFVFQKLEVAKIDATYWQASLS